MIVPRTALWQPQNFPIISSSASFEQVNNQNKRLPTDTFPCHHNFEHQKSQVNDNKKNKKELYNVVCFVVFKSVFKSESLVKNEDNHILRALVENDEETNKKSTDDFDNYQNKFIKEIHCLQINSSNSSENKDFFRNETQNEKKQEPNKTKNGIFRCFELETKQDKAIFQEFIDYANAIYLYDSEEFYSSLRCKPGQLFFDQSLSNLSYLPTKNKKDKEKDKLIKEKEQEREKQEKRVRRSDFEEKDLRFASYSEDVDQEYFILTKQQDLLKDLLLKQLSVEAKREALIASGLKCKSESEHNNGDSFRDIEQIMIHSKYIESLHFDSFITPKQNKEKEKEKENQKEQDKKKEKEKEKEKENEKENEKDNKKKNSDVYFQIYEMYLWQNKTFALFGTSINDVKKQCWSTTPILDVIKLQPWWIDFESLKSKESFTTFLKQEQKNQFKKNDPKQNSVRCWARLSITEKTDKKEYDVRTLTDLLASVYGGDFDFTFPDVSFRPKFQHIMKTVKIKESKHPNNVSIKLVEKSEYKPNSNKSKKNKNKNIDIDEINIVQNKSQEDEFTLKQETQPQTQSQSQSSNQFIIDFEKEMDSTS